MAVIGLGRIGWQWEIRDKKRPRPSTHLGAWLALEEEGLVKITGLCDMDKDRLREAGDVFEKRGSPVIQKTECHDLLKGEARPQIVSIATPTETHYRIAADCVMNGKTWLKGIFLEKPICDNLGLAKTLVSAAKETGIKLAVNHTRRWDPFWQRLRKRVVEEKWIGEPYSFFGFHSGDRVNDGVHMADLARWFKGEQPSEQHIAVLKDAPYLHFEVDIIGPKGRLRVTDNGRFAEWFKPYASKYYEGYEELRVSTVEEAKGRDGETPMLLACKDLVECVLDDEKKDSSSSREPLCTGTDGLLALEMVWGQQA